MTDAADAGDGSADAHCEERIDALLADLTLDEKVDLVHGAPDPSGTATGYVPANDRVGTPSLSLVDGPMGVRAGTATAFPAPLALGASFDPDLAREVGRAVAVEARRKGQDVLLAPGCNLVRVPQGGRNFEYFAEDPHLSARATVGYVDGVQSAGLVATPKHYVANSQERDRTTVSADVSERALRECYLRSFRAAVEEADAGAVMAAYNRVNGTHATSHERLLTDILKDEWEFDGAVMSDWWATTDTVAAARAGLDLDMPGTTVWGFLAGGSRAARALDRFSYPDWWPLPPVTKVLLSRVGPSDAAMPDVFRGRLFADPLREAVLQGAVRKPALDDKARRVLRTMARAGLLDGDRPDVSVDPGAHADLARRAAERGTVLLANDGLLPFADPDLDTLAVVGPMVDRAKVGGGGSSEVDPPRTVSPARGLRERAAAADVAVSVARGAPRISETSFGLGGDGDDDEPASTRADAVEATEHADAAVVVVQDDASEGFDRADLTLPGEQDALVEAVAAANDRTAVVAHTAGPIATPWADDIAALVAGWYPGQAHGDALARVLFGDVDPGGRLPVTFGREADYPTATDPARYPGVDGHADYAEGVFVGHRWFDREGVDPRFPFGHGESYAAFAYRDLDVAAGGGGDDATGADDGDGPPTGATATVTVENVGDRSGREVVQTYVAPEDPPVPRPPRELAGFAALSLAPGETERVTLSLDRFALGYYDEAAGEWRAPGDYAVHVGRSSRDLRLVGRV